LLFIGSLALTAHAFNLTDSKGKVHRLSDYRGKWVLVNFWATWCPPCRREIPDLESLYENKKNNLQVIGVALDYHDPQRVLDFAKQMMISYPVVLGNYKMAAQVGPVDALPTTYLYNPRGELVAYNVGALTKGMVERYIRRKGHASK
jgi:thiol-disulfide isomerase/thioredoxin